MAERWDRKRGLFYRRDPAQPFLSWVNNGGRDAPLSPRGRTIYRSTLLGLLVVFIVLLVVSVR